MAKAEWGLKRVCLACGARYYDMKKNPPVCPSCGTAYDPENQMRTRRGRSKPVEQRPEEVLDDIPVAGGDEAEDTVIEDVDELGDEDVEEVVEVEEEN